MIFTWDPYTNPIIADVDGDDPVRGPRRGRDGVARSWTSSPASASASIIEDREKKLAPAHRDRGRRRAGRRSSVRDFVIPVGAQLDRRGRARTIYAGRRRIAKIGREAYKTRDITGGLPRVAELFEARRPKDPATISEIDGVVRFGEIKRGKREIFVASDDRGRRDRRRATSRSCTKCRPASTCACTRATACAPATASPKVR